MFLFLDKTIEQIKILLVGADGKVVKRVEKKGKINILSAVSAVIKNKKISGIIAVAGPDSFSISRGKAAMANTLSFALDIPATGLDRKEFSSEKEMIKKGLEKIKKAKAGHIVLPVYDREPNITMK